MAGSSSSATSRQQRLSATSTSRSLLSRVRRDDAAAWDRLVQLYAPLVLSWCRRWRLKDDDMEDVFQEVFRTVARSIDRFQKERPTDTFRGWLRTIVHSRVHDHFRARGRQQQAIGGSEAQRLFGQIAAPEKQGNATDDPEAESGLYRRAVELIRSEFEERTWQAFWRTAVNGLSAREAADELEMTPGAVRVAKSRVLKRLREELGDVSE